MKKISLCFGIVLFLGLWLTPAKALTIIEDSQLKTSIDSSGSGTSAGIESDSQVTSSSTNKNSTASLEAMDSIKVEREDLAGLNETTELIDAKSVYTSADLSVYAKSIILSDQNIKEVNFEKDKVEITYQKEGKVLGLFKTKYDVETKVDSNGKIEVDYPWYAALIKGRNKPQVRQRMESEVSTFLDKNTNASGEIELSASVEARLANLIHTILVEELNGNVSIGSENNASTSAY